MGGTIGVRSTPGQGSTFAFTVRLGRVAGPTSTVPLRGRRRPAGGRPVRVVLTGSMGEVARLGSRTRGFELLSKPVRRRRLVECIVGRPSTSTVPAHGTPVAPARGQRVLVVEDQRSTRSWPCAPPEHLEPLRRQGTAGRGLPGVPELRAALRLSVLKLPVGI